MSKNGWSEVILEDITTKLGDGLHGTPKYKEDGDYHFINGNNLVNGHIIFNNKTKRVDNLQFHKYKKNLTDRTILVSINGTIGNVAFYNNEKVVLGKSACYFNLNDEIDKGFVRYILQSRIFQSYIESFSTGTTIMNVSLKTMREFAFKLPALQTQKAIAKILGDLDAKIELNRKMNENLEAMAQALFQSWFVDFDPVLDNFLAKNDNNVEALPEPLRKNGAIRLEISKKNTPEINKLFPNNFVFNEVLEKWIPEGWSDGKFGDIGEIITGKTPSAKNGHEFGNDFLFVTPTDFKNYHYLVINSIRKISKEGYNSNKNRILPKDSILVTCIGSDMGKVVIAKDECLTNQQINSIIPNNLLNTCYLYLHLKSIYHELRTLAFGGSTMPILNKTDFTNIKILIPGGAVNDCSKSRLNTFFDKIEINEKQSQNLTKLRDTLLPQLISGKLEVPEAILEIEKEIN